MQPPVHGDSPRALASGLSPLGIDLSQYRVAKHGFQFLFLKMLCL